MSRGIRPCCIVWICQYAGALASRHTATSKPSSEAVPIQERPSSSSLAQRAELLQHSRLYAGSSESLKHRMRQMTLDRAIEIVGQGAALPGEVRTLLQTLHGQSHSGTRLRSGLQAVAPDLGKAKPNLDFMVQGAMRKLDLEQIKCSEYRVKQVQMLESAKREMQEYAAQSASARSKILSAQEGAEKLRKGLAGLADTLRLHKQRCNLSMGAARKEEEAVQRDLEVMENLTAGMNCTETPVTTLLQCRGRRRGRLFLTFGHRALGQTLAGMRSSTRRTVLESLVQAFEPSKSRASFTAAGKGWERGGTPSGHQASLRESPGQRRRDAGGSDARSLQLPLFVPLGNISDAPSPQSSSALQSKQQSLCAIRGELHCESVLDQMLQLQTTMMDKVDEVEQELVQINGNCEETLENVNAQTVALEQRQADAQAALAEGVTVQTGSDEESRLKGLQVKELEKDYQDTMEQCKANTANFEIELCGVKNIRAEIFSMAGADPFIEDCGVGPWTPEECPVTCGGGTQKLKRQIVAFPGNGGVSCPPLEMVRRCNEQPCPVDCRVSEWSRFSSCTAKCGGGVRQRARVVERQPLHGGKACGEKSESQACNLEACDRDCQLADWSDWSTCSKMCNGGRSVRRRAEKMPAVGAGSCPDKDGPKRLEYLPCNDHICLVAPNQTTLRCDSKLDVVVLLDGSASLYEAGWQATQKFGQTLVRAFAGSAGIQLGLVLFSGPRSFKSFVRCSRGAKPGEPAPDMAAECGIRWVSHFTRDLKAVAQRIPSLAWPRGTTLTSAALTAAVSELRTARRDAASTVVVVTDGKPMSPRLTGQAAAMVRETARLLWVPVTANIPLAEVRTWSSKPVQENVIRISDFEMLQKPETINTLISTICPKVK